MTTFNMEPVSPADVRAQSVPLTQRDASAYGWPSQGQPNPPQAPNHFAGEPGFQSDLLDELRRTVNHNAIVTDAPKPRFRLGYFDVACLVVNRMIGTGIFNSPTTVIKGTQSTGGALLLWFFGIFYGLAGVHVYIEYGLNVPRYVIEGREQAVPRSGGDLHYLQYVYRWWYYKKDTVLYSGCLYGISFVIVGNMASNCLNFGSRVLQAARPGEIPDNGPVRAIAFTAAAFACVIHGISRRGGILLNNLLAVVKVGLLFVIVITTLVVVGGGIKDSQGNKVENVFSQNLDSSVAFKPPVDPKNPGAVPELLPEGAANGYAAALLSIIFAYSGFEQNNYVLGEIARPRRIFPRATAFGVLLVSVLYLAVNVCYMAVVPAHEQSRDLIALIFFRKTFGFAGRDTADRIFNSFLALSSFGNIIVMTYTASRMKQEIAKQGFLPFAKFLGQDVDMSVGRYLEHLRKRGWRLPYWLRPEQHREATPIGALSLHLATSFLLIFATYNTTPADAYDLLSGLNVYLTSAFFGLFLALGILILRFWGPPATEPARTKEYRESFNPSPERNDGFSDHPQHHQPRRLTWREMTGRSVLPWLSVVSAVIYLVGNAYPLVASWVPKALKVSGSAVKWWLVPGISLIILAFASAWWVGFLGVARYRERHQHKNLIHEVRPEFAWAEPATDDTGSDGDEFDNDRAQRRQEEGGKVLVKETVLFSWEGGEWEMFDLSRQGGGGGFGVGTGLGGTGARLHRRAGPGPQHDWQGQASSHQQQPAPPPPQEYWQQQQPAPQEHRQPQQPQPSFAPAPPPPPPPPPPVAQPMNEFAGTDFDNCGPPPPVRTAPAGERYNDW